MAQPASGVTGASVPWRRKTSSGASVEPWHGPRREKAGQFMWKRPPGFRQAAPWYVWTVRWCQNHWCVSADEA